jgi:hypothetical protein
MCIKLVIKTNLYYDAQSEKHQIKESVSQAFIACRGTTLFHSTTMHTNFEFHIQLQFN